MGYYPFGEKEINDEVRMLRLQLEHRYKCKKCYKTHSKSKCPFCGSKARKQRHNGYDWC